MFRRYHRTLVAVAYGILCSGLFAVAIIVMMVSLYHGMSLGIGTKHTALAFVFNVILVLQFAVLHSYFLTHSGRTLLKKLSPKEYASVLSPTLYVIFASIQIILVFLLWSPTNIPLWRPEGGPLYLLTVAYAASWLFLFKSMTDAGLGYQIGYSGWAALLKNSPLTREPFSTRGLFRFSRQPVYLAFSAVLLTAPIWTLDRLILTSVWTAYCIIGPRFKEKRYLRFYGDDYITYQREVNYWLPPIPGFHSKT